VPHEFLSPEWIAAVKALRDDHPGATASIPVAVRMNLEVTETPFASGVVHAHVDSSEGALMIDEGHVKDPDLTVTVDYVTAKALLVDGNPQAAMGAFMAGKIRIDGDMAKLMALQGTGPDEEAVAFAAAVRALTA
jgi:putative sterol carrier protein